MMKAIVRGILLILYKADSLLTTSFPHTGVTFLSKHMKTVSNEIVQDNFQIPITDLTEYLS